MANLLASFCSNVFHTHRSPPNCASRKTSVFHHLLLWRVECEVHVGIGGFVLAEVEKKWHPAPVRRRWRAHDDRRTARNLAHEVWKTNPRRKGRERWNCPFHYLLRVWVRPYRAVTHVACRFHDVLSN